VTNNDDLLIEFEHERAPSPLTYPGGKSQAIPIIAPLILTGAAKVGTKELVSPFLGGANIEVTCAQHGLPVHGSDIFRPVVNFWQWILTDPGALADAVERHLTAGLNDEEFRRLQAVVPTWDEDLEQAAAYYVLNKGSMYGMTFMHGPGNLSRVNFNGVEKLRAFEAPSLNVECLDFAEALAKHPHAFGYFDPPYEFAEEHRNSFYGFEGEAHRDFDHDRFFEAVRDRPGWIMSYNADDHVLDRYADFPMAFPRWNYGMTKTSKSNEVLIFSRDLADLAEVAHQRIVAEADDQAIQVTSSNDNTVAAATTTSWDTPDLSVLAETVTAAPPFPKAVLGTEWTTWCGSVAAGANAHFDYVAASLLAATAGLIGNSVTVGAHAAFVQPSVLWMCLVGKSGAGKTPATTIISDITDDVERKLGSRLRLRDVTVAASVKLAAENPKGQLLFRDEVSGWLSTIKRTGGEDFWLEAHNGKAFSKDRKNDEPLFVDNLSISVVGGAQPAVVKDITTDGKNRGFSARWLFAYPEPTLGYAGEEVQIDIDWATQALSRLAALPVGCGRLMLAPPAQARFRQWWDGKRREIADHDGLWAEWMQKQGGNALRLALVLELLKWAVTDGDDLPEAIEEHTLQDALALIDDWAIPMAQRTLEVMYRTPADQQAAALAKHLRRAKLTSFNARRLRRGEYGPAGALGHTATMEQACRTLMEARLIRFVGVRHHAHKGRASGDYEVNPLLLSQGVG